MRKLTMLVILLLLAALGYLAYAHFSGGAVPTFGLPIGGERAKIRQRTQAFFEHVKFKNASALKNFIAPDATEDDLTRFLTRIFGFTIDNVDLHSVHIEQVELNSSSTRARERVKLKGVDLTHNTPFTTEKIIFWYHGDQKWLLDIKNQL